MDQHRIQARLMELGVELQCNTTVEAVGDALAPGTIAAAVWEGRRFAEELENPTDDARRHPLPPRDHRTSRTTGVIGRRLQSPQNLWCARTAPTTRSGHWQPRTMHLRQAVAAAAQRWTVNARLRPGPYR